VKRALWRVVKVSSGDGLVGWNEWRRAGRLTEEVTDSTGILPFVYESSWFTCHGE
jgi:hypothetical protein